MTLTLTPTTPLERLKRRLRVAYEFALPDEQALADSIYRQRAQAWQQAMTEQAQRVGSRRTGRLPSGEDAARLRAQSIEDAQSIRATFNHDLEREIERLYAAQPDGNRDYYVSNLTRWADERAAWKDRQITLNNNKTARYEAMKAFEIHNRVSSMFRFAGPAPVCPDCADKFAMGEVRQQVVRENPTPRHPNCPHEWVTTQSKLGVPITELWVG